MDNLKFRAWDKTAKKMSKVTVIDFSTKPFRVFYKAYGNENYFNQDAILMQSTGLFDKNGKEIFEGDIVNYEFCDFRPNVASYETGGKYITGYKKAVLWENGKFICNDYDLLHICEDIEVIGNIYENKELLENE